MSDHVLLDLLNEFGKRDKMRGLSSILSLFHNEFNKFNKNEGTNIRFYISYDINNTLKSHFCCGNAILLSLCAQRYGRHNASRKSVNRH